MKNQLNNPNDFLKYSGLVIEMLVILLAGTFGGIKLDKHIGSEFPIFTVILSLLAVFIALYTVLKRV